MSGSQTVGAAPDARQARVRLVLGLLAAAALGSLLWWGRWETAPQHAYPDTYWYARQAATMTGTPPAEADRFAARLACRQGMPSPQPGASCVTATRQWAADLPPRYRRIFTTRPGYPLTVAPFVLAFGERGMVLATAALAVLAGVLAALAVRLLGGGLVAALAATALLFLLPTGFWLSRLLAEAGAIAFALAALCAAVPLLRRGGTARSRLLLGGAVAAGLLASTVTRPATGLLLSAALTAVLGALTLVRRHRAGWEAGLVVLTAACGVATAVWLGLSAALDIPGAEETLQDKFTVHFTRPDVPDPWPRLVELNRDFWPTQLDAWWNGGAPLAASPLLALLLVGFAALFRALPGRAALLFATTGATGLLTLVAHPKDSEADRLVLVIWLPVVVGLAMLLGRPARPAPDTPGEPGQPPA
ncbi:hypothetical protein KBX06_18240 [Micromonospora sp. C31]|uniref:hypothetical protein n=1 Tax=Micromonospora sp. C31 TaxID=2824876 RepID=UPI001B391166|nr:hypothetical protein [Micromonospora sp. C31]MBQ1075090.1 hypothetical protein [Micromonospora sp. C31]